MTADRLYAEDPEPPVNWSGVDSDDLPWVRRADGWHFVDCPDACDDVDVWGEGSSIAYPIWNLTATAP